MSVKIYHNPRCSKSRDTLKLLQAHGIEPEVIEYLKNPPTEDELRDILRKLGMSPRQLLRKKEAEFNDNGLYDEELSDDQVITVMVRNPRLIERPVVVIGDKAAVGRPPEAVLEILP